MNANETRKLAAALTAAPESRFEGARGLKDAVKALAGGGGGRAYLVRSEYRSLCGSLALDVPEGATVRRMARRLAAVGRECRRSPSLAADHRRRFAGGKGTIVFLDMFPGFPRAVEECLGDEFSGSSYRFEYVVGRVDRGAVGLEHTAFVSPANGYGYMRGGIDGAYAGLFPGIERRVQAAMKATRTYPLQPGQAVGVPAHPVRNTWLIAAPTMERPGTDVSGTSNAGWAFFAVLHEFDRLRREEGVTTLVCPGLGTGVGGMTEADCARQVLTALRTHVHGGTGHPSLYWS